MRALPLPLIFIPFLLISCGSRAAVKEDKSSISPGVFKKGKIILFIYKPTKPDITNVAITGDFNGWTPAGTPLTFDSGVWKITMELDYGIYLYKYVINFKTYMVDPYGESSAPDGMGGKNSVLEVKK